MAYAGVAEMYAKVCSVNFHMSNFHMFCFLAKDYPNLHPAPPVGPGLGCFPRGGENLCRFVPVQSSPKRAWGREFVHVCFGLLGSLVQVSLRGPRMGRWIRGRWICICGAPIFSPETPKPLF